ncbi:MAG: glycosyltransferase family 2 protein [Magnetococcales bacterium]|nr:glycosyltransferase family 2 protein [Magnetococcales bacterium]MBF0116787.1 glycosyltransferase family 2 protein [Magnetococcales bacterium]
MTLAIIPAYNESKAIGQVVAELLAQGLPVVVVDDCSTDDTRARAEQAGATVLRHPINLGYGSALQTGYQYAWQHGFQQVVQLDGDGQHDPKSAWDLLRVLAEGHHDLIIGSRFLHSESYRVPFLRRTGQKFFGAILNGVTGMSITDPTSGYQALSGKVIQFYCTRIFPDDFPDANILLLLHRKGFRIIEIPVRMYVSSSGSMHSGFFQSFYYVIKMMLSIFITLLTKVPGEENLNR